MKRMKRALTLLLAVMLACVLMAGYAMAAEEEAVWLVAEETAGVVSGKVETNAAVTNGVIRVTFDPAKLTYTGCDFAGEYEAYVAMNAVNDTKAAEGELQIAWVAPENDSLADATAVLFQVNFTKAPGNEEAVTASDVQVTGEANKADGTVVPVGEAPTEPTDPSEPTNPSEPTDPTETTNPSEQPTEEPTTETTKPATDPNGPDQTGDTANPVLAGMVLLISGLFLMGTVAYSRMRRGA
ncbi:MAG TPA: hypothetical protein IAB79_01050 [Candidatus Faecousia excrementipullorum]|nr:hypothetical protein [Candidatus Faecousia excrementipullorum]